MRRLHRPQHLIAGRHGPAGEAAELERRRRPAADAVQIRPPRSVGEHPCAQEGRRADRLARAGLHRRFEHRARRHRRHPRHPHQRGPSPQLAPGHTGHAQARKAQDGDHRRVQQVGAMHGQRVSGQGAGARELGRAQPVRVDEEQQQAAAHHAGEHVRHDPAGEDGQRRQRRQARHQRHIAPERGARRRGAVEQIDSRPPRRTPAPRRPATGRPGAGAGRPARHRPATGPGRWRRRCWAGPAWRGAPSGRWRGPRPARD